jgi:hypothetical protein
MEFPEELKNEIALQSETEFNNPTPDFGLRIRDLIKEEVGVLLPLEETNLLNGWQDLWLSPELTWADFVRWCWRQIKAWWDSLWNK